MAKKVSEPKQLAFEMVVWDRVWKPCSRCKNDEKKRASCWLCSGHGGWYVALLSKV